MSVLMSLIMSCTVHVSGDAQGVEYAFDLTVDNVYIELPSINTPPKPKEYEIIYDDFRQNTKSYQRGDRANDVLSTMY